MPSTRAIRDAATVILFRNPAAPEILMGQRGAAAAFMPNKVVFPGGAVDADDATVPLTDLPDPACLERLQAGDQGLANALIAAAIRELWEETGLVLGQPGTWPDPAPGWAGFAATGHRPSGKQLRYVFRAITPPGRPRRFDARFFLAPAASICGNINDFSRACDELSNLQWIPLDAVRNFDLPFITQVVLAEVAHLIHSGDAPESVPFFRNDDEESLFLRIGGNRLT